MKARAGRPVAEPEIRPDLSRVLGIAWGKIGAPGTWLSGAERVAIATEARQDVHCEFLPSAPKCSLGLHGVRRHDNAVVLPPPAIEAIHRIRTDPGRLGRSWYTRRRSSPAPTI